MIDYELFLEKMRALGMDYRWAGMFTKKLSDDEKAFPVSPEQAELALRHGFYPGRVTLYGLNEDNWSDYLPDYQYFMLHPMNNHFLKWLDKTTLKYVLNSNGCEDTMPDYYLYVEPDRSYTYLMDCPDDIKRDENFLFNLLKRFKTLAMKPNSGSSGGAGFIKLELRGDTIYENNRPIGYDRFLEIRDSMKNYIVTEYVKQSRELAQVWPDSECTLRVIMAKKPKKTLYEDASWTCCVSYARFGTSINGGASNLSSGGIGVGFDFETGAYYENAIRYRRYCPDGEWHIVRHPDTGFVWSGKYLPHWQQVKEKILHICAHISSLDYLGLDIIITEDGMKLCEINSHPAYDYEQVMTGPGLKKSEVAAFFEHKGLHEFDGDALYKAYTESQI